MSALNLSARGLLSWLPPSAAYYIYTVLLRPAPLRRLAQGAVKRMIPPTMDFRGARIALNQQDAIVSGSLALGCYETFVTDVLECLLQPGMTFVDVGANIGIYSALAAHRVGPAGRVLAVEPGPRNCAVLRESVRLNGFANVALFEGAASDVPGKASLFLCEDNPADHRLHDGSGQRRSVEVEVTTVDGFAAARGVRSADVIKVDTQGAEAAVFAGMSALLAAERAPVVLTEFWPWGLKQAGSDPRALLERFVAGGFALYELDGDHRAITARTDLDALAAADLERQHVNLLLCKDPARVEALRAALAGR